METEPTKFRPRSFGHIIRDSFGTYFADIAKYIAIASIVIIPVALKKGVLLVPESSVVYDKERKPSLEVPDPRGEGGKRKVAVKLGISNGVKTELVEGLKEGDKVVLQ